MNTCTPNHAKAYAQAQASADSSGHRRYLHFYNGSFWIDKTMIQDCEIIEPRQKVEKTT